VPEGSSQTSTRGSRPRARRDARSQEIVDIAARLFAERGYHATSIEDLSLATGLQRGGLYYYIGSKADLLVEIHERFIAPLLEEARAIEERNDPPAETIQALANALMRDIADYQDQVTVFLHEWRTVSRTEHPRAAEVKRRREEFEAVVDRCLQRGMEDGSFRIDDRRLAVLGFLGMINYSYQWYRPDGRHSAEDVASAFCSFFLDGVRNA
jgi:AcrR family transcriptional regulator